MRLPGTSRAAAALRRLSSSEPEQPVVDPFFSSPLAVHVRPEAITYREMSGQPSASIRPAPPVPLKGQLSAEHQQFLAASYARVDPAQCHWYHESLLRDGSRVAGGWDLIGGEDAYLGHADLGGKRVLEFGPATGHLTFWMERQGAQVVAFEAGGEATIDLISYGLRDTSAAEDEAMDLVERVHASWWWLRTHWNASARAARGSIYQLPEDLGTFDIATFGSILLHLRDPYRALEAAASITTDAMIVTDVVPAEFPQPSLPHMRFNPVPGDRCSWWLLSPGAVQQMLATVGFGRQEVSRHVQYYREGHDVSRDPYPVELYTVVARR